MQTFKRRLSMAALAAALAVAGLSPVEAAPKKEFTVAWPIYVGWMPWGYAADQSIVKTWADEYGIEIPEGCFGVESAVPGNLWKLLVEEGQSVQAGETLAIIESMKMEITVTAHAPGKVRDLRVAPGRTVKAGDVLVVLEDV